MFAADNRGFVYIINIYEEDKITIKDLREKKPKSSERIDVKINKIEIIEDPNNPKRRVLLVFTDFIMKTYRLKQEVKQQNMAGHTGPLLKMIALEPSKLERYQEKIPDKAKVITASLDNTILLWDYEKMDVLSRMEAPKNSELTCITFLYRCCLVASGHEDGAIRLWNMEINSSVLLKCQDPSKKHTNTISCITSTTWKGSEYLLCGSYDGKISIWEISEKVSNSEDNGGSSTITPQLRSVIDNKKVTHKDGDESTGNEILVIACWAPTSFHKQAADEEDSQQESYILVGGNSINVQVYSLKTGQLERNMEGHTDSITCMEIDENILFTGSDDGTIRQWNLNSFCPTGQIGSHGDQNAIQSLTLIKESGLLLSAGQDKTIKVWYTVKNVLIDTFEKSEAPLCLEYISEENVLLVGTESGNILTHGITDFMTFSSDDWGDFMDQKNEAHNYLEELEEKIREQQLELTALKSAASKNPKREEDLEASLNDLFAERKEIMDLLDNELSFKKQAHEKDQFMSRQYQD